MVAARLRVAFDANILIAGIRVPRWPHAVMLAVLNDEFELALPQQVLVEARRNLPHPDQVAVLERYLVVVRYEQLPAPPDEAIQRNLHLVRDETDVPIALALLTGMVDVLVSLDRDFTEPNATLLDFRRQVRVMLPAIFLRDIIGWDSVALEKIRARAWSEVEIPWAELGV
jgi:predicted nucleic acid-binding protein